MAVENAANEANRGLILLTQLLNSPEMTESPKNQVYWLNMNRIQTLCFRVLDDILISINLLRIMGDVIELHLLKSSNNQQFQCIQLPNLQQEHR